MRWETPDAEMDDMCSEAKRTIPPTLSPPLSFLSHGGASVSVQSSVIPRQSILSRPRIGPRSEKAIWDRGEGLSVLVAHSNTYRG